MSHAYTDTAESIVEHALAITRLDARQLGEPGYAAACAEHVHAMRLLATAHVDPSLDRAFHKALMSATARAPGIAVRLVDGVLGVIIDTADRQHRFELSSPRQVERRGDADPFS